MPPETEDNVVDIGNRQRPLHSGNGGGTIDARLRHVENLVARIDERTKRFATREDLLGVKLWVVGGVIGGFVTAAGFVLAILKLFMTDGS